jgi:hypothetical protein
MAAFVRIKEDPRGELNRWRSDSTARIEFLVTTGGLSRQSAYKIELLREGLDGRLTTTRFDMRDIKSGKAQDLRLQSGDRIEIAH